MNTNEELKPDQPGYKYAQLKKEPTKQDVIDYLKLKTRPDFTEINRKLYLATQSNLTIQELMNLASDDVWTTHVEPLQAKNEELTEAVEYHAGNALKNMNALRQVQSENQKLRGTIEAAFVAGRSKTSWEQFQKDNGLKTNQ